MIDTSSDIVKKVNSLKLDEKICRLLFLAVGLFVIYLAADELHDIWEAMHDKKAVMKDGLKYFFIALFGMLLICCSIFGEFQPAQPPKKQVSEDTELTDGSEIEEPVTPWKKVVYIGPFSKTIDEETVNQGMKYLHTFFKFRQLVLIAGLILYEIYG